MKTANGEYREVIVTATEDIGVSKRVFWSHAQAMQYITATEDTGVSKRVFWSHAQAMQYINDNAPITVLAYYEREPARFTPEAFPELYED